MYVAYANRDLNEKGARKIKPLKWIRYDEALEAFCFKDKFEKTYCVNKIRRIEDNTWMVPIVEGKLSFPQILSSLFVAKWISSTNSSISQASTTNFCGRMAKGNGT